jgi:hypothetical protein
MNFVRILVTLVFVSLLSPCCEAEVPLCCGSVLHFASTKEAQIILTTKDDFIERLSPFDRSARMKVDRPISEDEFLAFVGKNALDWTESEKQSVQQTVHKVQSVLQGLRLSFPETVTLIKTTGVEEGNAAYTRGESIMVPKAELTKDRNHLEKLICHELFHILSRKNSSMREKLYELIGFHKCEELDLPVELKSRKITNPDAPRNDHFIRLKIDGRECQAVPILLSTAATYDVARGGEFFDYLSFKFLVIKEDPATSRSPWNPTV